MRPNGFSLAATTDDLKREPQVRDVADLIEFRMDKAEDPLEQLSSYDGELSIVATNRARGSGGQAPETGRLDGLVAASEFGSVEMVDVELETARESGWILTELRGNDVDVIVSYHAFEDTPDLDVLGGLFEQCSQLGDVAKVATYADEYTDALRMLTAVHEATQEGQQVVGISMGGVGSHTRVVAPFYGSKLGYAPLESDGSDYAPGQIPIHRLASMIDTLGAAEAQELDRLLHEENPRPTGAAKTE